MDQTTPEVKIVTNRQQTRREIYDEIKTHFIKGIPLKDLAEKYQVHYGNLRAYATKNNWRKQVAVANQHILDKVTNDLTASASHWTHRIDKLMHKGLDHFEDRLNRGKELKLPELVQLADFGEKLNRTFRSNAGMDRDSQSNKIGLAINVNLANSQSHADHVIDVATIDDCHKAD